MKTIKIQFMFLLCLAGNTMAIPRCSDYWDAGQGKLLPSFWDGVKIIYAVTGDVKVVASNEDLPFELPLRPLATIVGEIDPLKENNISARIVFGGLTEVIEGPPDSNIRVIVVIRKRKNGPGYEVPPFPMEFMPNGTAIVPITGDPTPVIEKIQMAVRMLRSKKPQP